MPLSTFTSDHGATVGVDNLGDGDCRITIWSNLGVAGVPVGDTMVSVALQGEEVEKLRDLLDDVLNDY
jgi:hypothetical protein